MDVLTVIILLIILILVMTNKANVNQKFTLLELRIIELQNLFRQRNKESKTTEPVKETVEKPIPLQPPPPVKLPDPPKPEEIKPEPVVERQKEVIKDTYKDPFEPIKRPVKTWEPPQKVKDPKPTFFERNPDLEKFIGENLVNKIGIAI